MPKYGFCLVARTSAEEMNWRRVVAVALLMKYVTGWFYVVVERPKIYLRRSALYLPPKKADLVRAVRHEKAGVSGP